MTGETQDLYVIVSAAAISDVISLGAVGTGLADMGAIVPLAKMNKVTAASVVIAPRERVESGKILSDLHLPADFVLSDNTVYIAPSAVTSDEIKHFSFMVTGKFELANPTKFELFASEQVFEGDCPFCEPSPEPVCPSACWFCWLCQTAESLTEFTVGGPANELVVTHIDNLIEQPVPSDAEGMLVILPIDDVPEASLVVGANAPAGALVAVPLNSDIETTGATLVIVPRDAVAAEDIVGTFISEEPIGVSANKAILLSVQDSLSSQKMSTADVIGVITLNGMDGLTESSAGILSVDGEKAEFPIDK